MEFAFNKINELQPGFLKILTFYGTIIFVFKHFQKLGPINIRRAGTARHVCLNLKSGSCQKLRRAVPALHFVALTNHSFN